jgi:hypothetical protein
VMQQSKRLGAHMHRTAITHQLRRMQVQRAVADPYALLRRVVQSMAPSCTGRNVRGNRRCGSVHAQHHGCVSRTRSRHNSQKSVADCLRVRRRLDPGECCAGGNRAGEIGVSQDRWPRRRCRIVLRPCLRLCDHPGHAPSAVPFRPARRGRGNASVPCDLVGLLPTWTPPRRPPHRDLGRPRPHRAPVVHLCPHPHFGLGLSLALFGMGFWINLAVTIALTTVTLIVVAVWEYLSLRNTDPTPHHAGSQIRRCIGEKGAHAWSR